MSKEVYLVFEYDYGDHNKDYLSMDINKAVSKALSFNCKDYRVYIDIFELDGKKLFSYGFMEKDKIDADELKSILENKNIPWEG